MEEIKAFRGVLYNRQKVKEIEKVVTPPYDVILPEEREYFYNAHPYNIVRIILPESYPDDDDENNKYTRAGQTFDSSGSWERPAEESLDDVRAPVWAASAGAAAESSGVDVTA